MSELTNHKRVAIPRTLNRRPKYKGWPVPYTVLVGADGVPDFRVNDTVARHRAAVEKLCALCGGKLPPNWSAFVGGPLCEANHLFVDGPMHEVCARYALTICPYLVGSKGHAMEEATRRRHALSPDLTILTDEKVSDQRPDRMGLFLTREWRYGRIDGLGDDTYFQVPEFAIKEWYA